MGYLKNQSKVNLLVKTNHSAKNYRSFPSDERRHKTPTKLIEILKNRIIEKKYNNHYLEALFFAYNKVEGKNILVLKYIQGHCVYENKTALLGL